MSHAAGTPTIGADDTARRLDELRPLASASRLAITLMAALSLWSDGYREPVAYAVAVGFLLLIGSQIWRETRGVKEIRQPVHYALTVLAFVVVARVVDHGILMFPVAIHPVTMVTLLFGYRLGMAVAAFSAAALLLSIAPPFIDTRHLPPALGLLLVPPIALLVSRPVQALRQRVQLAAELQRELDPRRGVQAVGQVIAERLREATGARRVILCHRDAEVSTVLVAERDERAYAASPALAGRLLAVLAELPVQPWSTDGREPAPPPVQQLAALLEARPLQLVPDRPGDPRAGWLLLDPGGDGAGRHRRWRLHALAAFAVDLRRLVQQASYVDSLQAEIAAHERARIGRDLHDSAVQPYLGLKFAIEVLAQRCDAGNPLHDQVHDLRRACEAELDELRDTVAVLRTGEVRGDNTLVPALRRQARRFDTLFGIHTELDVPEALVTSRALSGAVLHMVNEALNNVRRHTRAQTVWVRLAASADALQLSVRDDAGQRSGQPAPPFEPRSLAERARELGGTLALHRVDGLDTEIRIRIPV